MSILDMAFLTSTLTSSSLRKKLQLKEQQKYDHKAQTLKELH